HISYGKILQIYFSVAHNPTELNRQGPDFGTQYRSAIFYADDEQRRIASAYIAQLQQAHVFGSPIVTKLEPLSGFYPAEDYHQDFLVLHPSYPYIVFNDLPKLDNLKQAFPDYYRETPVTIMASRRPTQHSSQTQAQIRSSRPGTKRSLLPVRYSLSPHSKLSLALENGRQTSPLRATKERGDSSWLLRQR